MIRDWNPWKQDYGKSKTLRYTYVVFKKVNYLCTPVKYNIKLYIFSYRMNKKKKPCYNWICWCFLLFFPTVRHILYIQMVRIMKWNHYYLCSKFIFMIKFIFWCCVFVNSIGVETKWKTTYLTEPFYMNLTYRANSDTSLSTSVSLLLNAGCCYSQQCFIKSFTQTS